LKQKTRIAIYGLGQETKKNIEQLSKKYEIVGLLDSFLEIGNMYGFSIISIDEAFFRGVQRIIVIARPGSCKAIARKIGAKCIKAGISLMDIDGNDLLLKKNVRFDFENVKGYKKSDLLELINKAEVVSFDLFDTLVIRKIIHYEDMLELVAHRVAENGFVVENCAEKRLRSEIELSRSTTPSLYEIYEYMCRGMTTAQIEKLVSIEHKCDMDLLSSRIDMVEILEFCIQCGKKVYISTDTYYREKQIKDILRKCNIHDSVEIIASCEIRTAKTEGLFGVLKNKNKGAHILHIGDDYRTDIEGALKYGIDTFHIYSGTSLYEMIGEMGMPNSISSVSDKIKVGMIISKMFNSPFMFEEKEAFSINELKTIGYVFFAPMILDFAYWIGIVAKRNHNSNILFSSRDGYVIRKIYELIFGDKDSYYFLTSRIAALRACMETRADIEYVESTKFSGSEIEKLKIRYGLTEEECLDCCNGNCKDVMQYRKLIFQKAMKKRENYLKYIDANINFDKEEVLFVDLSARGTIQMFCERILERKMKGLYFLQLEPEFAQKYSLDINPFYLDEGKEGKAIFDDFYIIEPIISSPKPSLDEFDINGTPIYSKEERSQAEINTMLEIQEGMLEYIREYVVICPLDLFHINKQLDCDIFELIHNISIVCKDFYGIRNIDPFVNRITDLKVEV